MCKYVKCSIPIMKSNRTSGGTDRSCHLLKVNRRKCCHFLSVGKISSIDGPFPHLRWTSVVCSNGSISAKPCNVALTTSNRSISTWRQTLTIYEEVSSDFIIFEAINVTSFISPASQVVTSSTFSFLRRAISLCKSFGWSIRSSFRLWVFKQAERIHCTSSEIENSRAMLTNG